MMYIPLILCWADPLPAQVTKGKVMFTSNDINEIIAGSNERQAKALIEEMNIKPTCPNCGGDCKKENMGSHGEPRYMVYKCQSFCKTWVYQPEWVECESEVCPTSLTQTVGRTPCQPSER